MKMSMPLVQVIEFYDKKVKQMHQDKTNEYSYCKNGIPVNVNRCEGILRDAINVYTLVLFKMFEYEFSLA